MNKMARVSKTSPFRPSGQPQTRSNHDREKKDEERSCSSSRSRTTSSSNSEEDTQDKKQEKAKGKRPIQTKRGNHKSPLYESIFGPERSKATVTKRGRGKPAALAVRLKGVDEHMSTEFETKITEAKPISTQDKEKAKGKRPMQSKTKRVNPNATLYEMISGPERAKGTVTKRGRGKPMAYTLRLWKKYNLRPLRKVKEDRNDVFRETDVDEACKRTKIERRDDDDDDIDNDRPGAGTHRNLTSFGIEVVAK